MLDSEGSTSVEFKIRMSDLPTLSKCPSLLLFRLLEEGRALLPEQPVAEQERVSRRLADNLREIDW